MEKKFQLPKEFAEKWLGALRSGEYKQGRGALCKNDKYCCLGVADKIAGYDPLPCDTIPKFHANVPSIIRGDGELPGLLASKNDEGGQSFMQIANWIESNCEFI